jgi:hypothetical protein
MSDKKIKWHKVADSREAIEWQTNRMAVVDAGGKKGYRWQKWTMKCVPLHTNVRMQAVFWPTVLLMLPEILHAPSTGSGLILRTGAT